MSQCDFCTCLLPASSVILGAVKDSEHLRSSSTSSLFRAFVLIASRLENPDSHRYVDEKGMRILRARWLTAG